MPIASTNQLFIGSGRPRRFPKMTFSVSSQQENRLISLLRSRIYILIKQWQHFKVVDRSHARAPISDSADFLNEASLSFNSSLHSVTTVLFLFYKNLLILLALALSGTHVLLGLHPIMLALILFPGHKRFFDRLYVLLCHGGRPFYGSFSCVDECTYSNVGALNTSFQSYRALQPRKR